MLDVLYGACVDIKFAMLGLIGRYSGVRKCSPLFVFVLLLLFEIVLLFVFVLLVLFVFLLLFVFVLLLRVTSIDRVRVAGRPPFAAVAVRVCGGWATHLNLVFDCRQSESQFLVLGSQVL